MRDAGAGALYFVIMGALCLGGGAAGAAILHWHPLPGVGFLVGYAVLLYRASGWLTRTIWGG